MKHKYPTMPAAEFKSLRETAGSQQDVAHEMQTNRRTLNRWETGERPVPGIAAAFIRKLSQEAAHRRLRTLAAAKDMGARADGR